MSIADLLPAVRGILPLTDIDALNRLTVDALRRARDHTGRATSASQ